MAVGELDIAVAVDATSATAGFRKAEAAAKKFNGEIEQFGKSATRSSREYNRAMTSMQQSSKLVAFQLGDIGQQLASGAGGWRVMLQQTEQLGQALRGTGGIMGGIRAVGAGLMSLLSPTNLVIGGLILAAGYVVDYFTKASGEESKAAEEALERHKALVADIKQNWKDLPSASEGYLKDVRESLGAAVLTQDVETQRQAMIDEGKKIAAGLLEGFGDLGKQLQDPIFAPYADAIANFLASGDMEQFRDELIETNLRMQEQGLVVGSLGTQVGMAGRAWLEAGGDIGGLNAALIEFANTVETDPVRALETLSTKLQQVKDQFGDTSPEGKAAAAIQTQIAALLPLAQAYEDARVKAEAANRQVALTGPAAMSSVPGVHQLGGAVSTLAGQLDAAAARANAFNGAMSTLMSIGLPALTDMQVAEQAYADAMKNSAGNTTLMLSATKELADARERIAQRAKEAEDALGGRGGGGGGSGGSGGGGGGTQAATDANRVWLDSLLDAGDQSRVFQRELDRLNEMQRTGAATSEEYAAALKVLESRYKGVGKAATESFDAAKTFASIMDQWGQQVASSLADAIVEGENLEDVFKSLLKQLLKMIIQMMILEPLMKSVMSGFGGMGGGTIPMGIPMSTRSLTAPGSFTSRNVRSGGNSGSATVTNSYAAPSFGPMTINIGEGVGVEAGDPRARRFGRHLRDVIQQEIAVQGRPGGLLWRYQN